MIFPSTNNSTVPSSPMPGTALDVTSSCILNFTSILGRTTIGGALSCPAYCGLMLKLGILVLTGATGADFGATDAVNRSSASATFHGSKASDILFNLIFSISCRILMFENSHNVVLISISTSEGRVNYNQITVAILLSRPRQTPSQSQAQP